LLPISDAWDHVIGTLSRIPLVRSGLQCPMQAAMSASAMPRSARAFRCWRRPAAAWTHASRRGRAVKRHQTA